MSDEPAETAEPRRTRLLRVAAHVRTQNWTAIGIDFLIVVLGVFVGIQVANWNEARVERELVRGHLGEIAEDLRTHLGMDESLLSSARLRIAAVDYVQREAFGTTLPTTLMLGAETWQAPPPDPFPLDKLDHLMGSINLVRISVRSRNAYESLVSAGRLGLLRNRPLARQIQTYYGNYDDLLDTQTTVFRTFRNDGAREQYALGVSVFDQRPAAEIIALARDNTAFAAYLRTQRELAIVHWNLLSNLGGDTEALLADIERELATP
jgi:hypothetical protein